MPCERRRSEVLETRDRSRSRFLFQRVALGGVRAGAGGWSSARLWAAGGFVGLVGWMGEARKFAVAGVWRCGSRRPPPLPFSPAPSLPRSPPSPPALRRRVRWGRGRFALSPFGRAAGGGFGDLGCWVWWVGVVGRDGAVGVRWWCGACGVEWGGVLVGAGGGVRETCYRLNISQRGSLARGLVSEPAQSDRRPSICFRSVLVPFVCDDKADASDSLAAPSD